MNFKTGWRPDVPDMRDYHYRSAFGDGGEEPYLARKAPCLIALTYPKRVDLRERIGMWPPVFDQEALGSCVENACAASMAYTLAKEGAQPLVLSRLFLYFNVRKGAPDDTGSTIRDGFKAMGEYGDCREELWPYALSEWKVRPTQLAYDDAIKRKAIKYARLKTLNDMMHCLSSGFPFVFGMMLYTSFFNITAERDVCPMPTYGEDAEGGHALTAVGYDRGKRLFLIRNSWGASWGKGGYFWLPFDYAMDRDLADDFWTFRSVPVAKRSPVVSI